jgi:hypothetical protein
VDIDATTRLRRGPATWTMLGLAAALSALPVASAVGSVLKAAGVLAVDPEAALDDGLAAVGIVAEERSLRVAEGFAALVSVPVAITCLLVLYGLLAWKDWSREATLGVFGLSGMFLLVMSLNGLAQGGPRAGVGVVGSLLVLGVAGLAVSPGVRDDFERRRLQRELRAREAATAARRQRLDSPG